MSYSVSSPIWQTCNVQKCSLGHIIDNIFVSTVLFLDYVFVIQNMFKCFLLIVPTRYRYALYM